MLQLYKRKMDQQESDLLSVVHSLLLSIEECDLHTVKEGYCNLGCVRHSLVKLLKLSGYDAAVCVSKWQTLDRVPGGTFTTLPLFWAQYFLDDILHNFLS